MFYNQCYGNVLKGELMIKFSKTIILLSIVFLGSTYSQSNNKDVTNLDNEIGKNKVTKIKKTLKGPLLTLLASSEYITHDELDSRIEKASHALEQIKSELKEED